MRNDNAHAAIHFPAELGVGSQRLTIYRNAYEAYPEMLVGIRTASKSISLETYIFREDDIGREFIEALCERARSGVQVRVIYDWWGSNLSPRVISTLRENGVHPLAFAPTFYQLFQKRFFARWRRRDHRKSLIIDGKVAFLGGLNIASENLVPQSQGGWRDTHLRIVGASATAVDAAFDRTWRWGISGGIAGVFVETPTRTLTSDANSSVQIITQGIGTKKEIRRAYLRAFSQARERVLVTQAYFLPPRRVLRALLEASRRGVEVTLILAGKSDVPAVTLASRHLYSRFLRAGARIFELRTRVLHAKTAVIDGEWSTVGSANLDAQSLYHNLEINAVIKDQTFAAALEQLGLEDMRESLEITPGSWKNRAWFARLVSWVAYRLRWWL